MPQIILNVTPELLERINDWSRQSKQSPENLAIDLLEEYFDDCDDADRLEALISSGNMKTYPANIDWADMPLTAEEEAGLIHGRENIKSGDFMTLTELKNAYRQ